MSDILIKNMELPKEGGLVIEITKHGQVAQLFRDGSLLRKGIKAIELPPHGALIDRHELVRLVECWSACHTAIDFSFSDFIKLIYDAPVVVEASK